MTTQATRAIVYPETDGMPIPDGLYQSRHFVELISVLSFFFSALEDVVVAGDIFLYYEEGNRQARISPDCMVVFGVSMESFERNDTYLMWEVGKAPDFVLEIGSPSTAANDLGGKRDLYTRLGIGEYWRFDPSGGEHYGDALAGEVLVGGEYRELEMVRESDGEVWGRSDTLNLELHWVEGRLRLYDPVGGRWLENMEEAGARADTAEAVAEMERSARDAAEAEREMERAARRTAEARAAELEAEVRRLRGE